MSFFFKKPTLSLPKIEAAKATEVASKYQPSPQGQALLTPEQTPGEYIGVLEKNKAPMDAANVLSHGMSERDSVFWASKSAEKVSDKLNPEEKSAMVAAQDWVKNPNPDTQSAASAAAAKTDFKGPGGWAAQAAAWSKPDGAGGGLPTAAPAVPAAGAPAPAAPAAPGLVGSAVTGAVLLAAGLTKQPAMGPPQKPQMEAPALAGPKAPAAPGAPDAPGAPKAEAPPPPQAEPPPVDQAKLAKPMQPFLDLGKEIAAGTVTWS